MAYYGEQNQSPIAALLEGFMRGRQAYEEWQERQRQRQREEEETQRRIDRDKTDREKDMAWLDLQERMFAAKQQPKNVPPPAERGPGMPYTPQFQQPLGAGAALLGSSAGNPTSPPSPANGPLDSFAWREKFIDAPNAAMASAAAPVASEPAAEALSRTDKEQIRTDTIRTINAGFAGLPPGNRAAYDQWVAKSQELRRRAVYLSQNLGYSVDPSFYVPPFDSGKGAPKGASSSGGGGRRSGGGGGSAPAGSAKSAPAWKSVLSTDDYRSLRKAKFSDPAVKGDPGGAWTLYDSLRGNGELGYQGGRWVRSAKADKSITAFNARFGGAKPKPSHDYATIVKNIWSRTSAKGLGPMARRAYDLHDLYPKASQSEVSAVLLEEFK